MRWLLIALVLVAAASATSHTDLHRARKHHSSLQSASHRRVLHHTNNWVVKPSEPTDFPSVLVAALNRALSSGSVRMTRVTRMGLWVLEATPSTNADELATILMSEQRANMIEWFHRDSVTRRQSH